MKNLKMKNIKKKAMSYVMVLMSVCTLSLNVGSIEAQASDIYVVSNGQADNTTMVFKTVAYTGGGITASGMAPKRNPDGISTVAVDPSVIPYGTAMYIEGYGYAVAADCGSGIKGNMIDLYLNSEQECINWGVRNVNVTILGDSSNK